MCGTLQVSRLSGGSREGRLDWNVMHTRCRICGCQPEAVFYAGAGHVLSCPACIAAGVDEWSVQTWPWNSQEDAEREWEQSNKSASHGSTPTCQPEQLALW